MSATHVASAAIQALQSGEQCRTCKLYLWPRNNIILFSWTWSGHQLEDVALEPHCLVTYYIEWLLMGLTREMFNSISLLLCLVTDVMSQLGRKGAT